MRLRRALAAVGGTTAPLRPQHDDGRKGSTDATATPPKSTPTPVQRLAHVPGMGSFLPLSILNAGRAKLRAHGRSARAKTGRQADRRREPRRCFRPASRQRATRPLEAAERASRRSAACRASSKGFEAPQPRSAPSEARSRPIDPRRRAQETRQPSAGRPEAQSSPSCRISRRRFAQTNSWPGISAIVANSTGSASALRARACASMCCRPARTGSSLRRMASSADVTKSGHE